MKAFKSVLAWAKRNERWLSSVFFLGGFVGDIVAFTLLEVGVVNIIFAAYLLAGGAAILLAHYLSARPQQAIGLVRRTLLIVLPLFVQYAVGSILSGSLVFYTKSATLVVSWPFLLLLAVVFFGNEVFRDYREHLAFQTTLFFFGLYSYIIFAFPFLLGRLGPDVFLMSTAIAAGIFAAFLFLLYMIGKQRFESGVKVIAMSSVVLVALMNGAYFTGLIPPLPLGLKDAAPYHLVERQGEGYRVLKEEERPWWRVWEKRVVHHVPGSPLYVYSAVFAPVRFSANVVHVWERKAEDGWIEENRVAFPVSGGRGEGYRGYSIKSNPAPGEWRVSIQTPSGQTIGRIWFVVENADAPPRLLEETR